MVNINRRVNNRIINPALGGLQNRVQNLDVSESYYLNPPLATLLDLNVDVKHRWVQVTAKMINYIKRNHLNNPARIIYPNLEMNNVLGVVDPINFSQLGYLLQDQLRIR